MLYNADCKRNTLTGKYMIIVEFLASPMLYVYSGYADFIKCAVIVIKQTIALISNDTLMQ